MKPRLSISKNTKKWHWWLNLGFYSGELFMLFQIQIFNKDAWEPQNWTFFDLRIGKFMFAVGTWRRS